jgi:hypothetical protein
MQQQQISFSISVQQIEELEGTSAIHSYTLDKVGFTQNVTNQGKNQLYNYSGILENAAVINVLVSVDMIFPPTYLPLSPHLPIASFDYLLVWFFGEAETPVTYAGTETIFQGFFFISFFTLLTVICIYFYYF